MNRGMRVSRRPAPCGYPGSQLRFSAKSDSVRPTYGLIRCRSALLAWWAATQVAATQCAIEVVAPYDIALAAVRAAPEDDLAGEVTGMRYADAACGCARTRSARAAPSCPVLAIGLGED